MSYMCIGDFWPFKTNGQWHTLFYTMARYKYQIPQGNLRLLSYNIHFSTPQLVLKSLKDQIPPKTFVLWHDFFWALAHKFNVIFTWPLRVSHHNILLYVLQHILVLWFWIFLFIWLVQVTISLPIFTLLLILV